MMHIKTLLVILVISIAFGGPLLGITNFFNNNIIYNNHQAFATHMGIATSNKKTVVHQGIIASSPSPQIKPRPNEQLQTAVILPFRSDGST
jgi:hypothetical protein